MSAAAEVAIVVIAKAPQPGRSKTRLCPPCRPEEAAALAQASLRDTLAAVGAARARRRVIALEGEPGPWLPDGFDVVRQRGSGLGERLAHALASVGGPAIVVGMDTPQLTPRLLEFATARLLEPGIGAVLGPALDGGYWTIGLRRPDPAVFLDVPMSTEQTCTVQRRRLRGLGLRWAELPELCDVDTIADARTVGAAAPATCFARMLRQLSPGRPVAEPVH